MGGVSNHRAIEMHQAILSELATIQPFDQLEREHLIDAIDWVRSGAALCRIAKPATPAKHLVAYFALVDRGSILLVDHVNAQLWLPTGGHVEPGEHPRKTVARELAEELGLRIDPLAVGPPLMVTCTTTVGLTAGHTDVSLWYVVRSNRKATLVFDEAEFRAVRWFGFSSAPLCRSDPHLGRFLSKLRREPASRYKARPSLTSGVEP